MHHRTRFRTRSAAARYSYCCVFIERQHLGFWDFNSTVLVDVVRVKSYMNYPYHHVCVEMGITINTLYYYRASGVVGVL